MKIVWQLRITCKKQLRGFCKMSQGIEPLSVKRVYRQSQEAVFRAWTVPERLQKWFCPNPEH